MRGDSTAAASRDGRSASAHDACDPPLPQRTRCDGRQRSATAVARRWHRPVQGAARAVQGPRGRFHRTMRRHAVPASIQEFQSLESPRSPLKGVSGGPATVLASVSCEASIRSRSQIVLAKGPRGHVCPWASSRLTVSTVWNGSANRPDLTGRGTSCYGRRVGLRSASSCP